MNGADVGNVTIRVGDYSYDESTSPSTYHIYSELGLNYWAESDNVLTANVTFERDITLTEPADVNGSNWMGVGGEYNDRDGYAATFNGKNHTISGLRMRQTNGSSQRFGFFRVIAVGGTAKNLKLTDVNIRSASSYVGAIAGVSRGRIENCSVSGKLIRGYHYYTGGIAGYSYGDIDKCTNHCIVVSAGQSAKAGGIAGGAETGTISNCDNHGEIIASGYYRVAAGGIAGYISSKLTITSCKNHGDVVGQNTDTTDFELYLGGLVGYFLNGKISNCSIGGEAININAYWKQSDAITSYGFGPFDGYRHNTAIIGDNNTGVNLVTINQHDLNKVVFPYPW